MSASGRETIRLTCFALLVAVFGKLAGFNQHADAQERIVGWNTTINDAQAVAKATGKPIMLVFRCVQ